MVASERFRRRSRVVVHFGFLVGIVFFGLAVGATACSGGDSDDNVVVLALPSPVASDAQQHDDAAPLETTSNGDQANSSIDATTPDHSGSTDQVDAGGDAFVSEAVADANAAEQRYVPTATPTLLPRRTTPEAQEQPKAEPTEAQPEAALTADPVAVEPGTDAAPSGPSGSSESASGQTRPDGDGQRPSPCRDGFERVYEAFATDSPPIGIAICVAADGQAEYVGLDVATNNRIRLSACVDDGNFVATNGGSLYVVDIANDSIRYPQSPRGRHLDNVTMITSASTIPALGC